MNSLMLIFTCCAFTYLLGKLQMTDKAVLYFWRKPLSHWTIYFMLLDQGIYCGGSCWRWSIFLCSGRRSFTVIFHELDLKIFSYCLPTTQALWPGIAPLSMWHPKGWVTLLCGQLCLVWGVFCWLVCWRKLRAWQMGCAACSLVYLTVVFWFFACVYVCVCCALPISSFV